MLLFVSASGGWRATDGSTKGRRSRSVPLTARLEAALDAIKVTKLRGPYVLSRQDGQPYGAEHMNDTINRIARTAGVTNCYELAIDAG